MKWVPDKRNGKGSATVAVSSVACLAAWLVIWFGQPTVRSMVLGGVIALVGAAMCRWSLNAQANGFAPASPVGNPFAYTRHPVAFSGSVVALGFLMASRSAALFGGGLGIIGIALILGFWKESRAQSLTRPLSVVDHEALPIFLPTWPVQIGSGRLHTSQLIFAGGAQGLWVIAWPLFVGFLGMAATLLGKEPSVEQGVRLGASLAVMFGPILSAARRRRNRPRR